jgi:hypothetical protein
MRLIVHLGFHKTASTYLQHLLNGNARALTARGIWYDRQKFYPAHHQAAWALLAGDAMPLELMLRTARLSNCHTVILSSEDLEAIPFNPDIMATIEATAAALGVTELEWHIVVREPGAYFASLHAQLQHHVYADTLVMLREVLKKGMVFIPEPLAGEPGAPYWFYCFDHHGYIAAFAARTAHRVVVHDYADADPYPGWRMIDRLGALDAIVKLPDAEGENRRMGADAVAAGYRARIADAIGADPSPAFEALLAANLAAVPEAAAIVGARFGDSYRAAVTAFPA